MAIKDDPAFLRLPPSPEAYLRWCACTIHYAKSYEELRRHWMDEGDAREKCGIRINEVLYAQLTKLYQDKATKLQQKENPK